MAHIKFNTQIIAKAETIVSIKRNANVEPSAGFVIRHIYVNKVCKINVINIFK